MSSRYMAALRGLAVAVALILGLSSVTGALAQDTVEPPAGLTDGATITYQGEDGSALVFSVFQFEDDAAAEAGIDAVLELASSSSEDTGLAESGEGVTEISDDVEGLDGLGDEARAFELPLGESGVSFVYLIIRDGANVHLWLYGGSESAAAATPDAEATPEVEATPAGDAPIDTLVAIGSEWLGTVDADAALIDQLPTQEYVPEGFTEIDRQESLS